MSDPAVFYVILDHDKYIHFLQGIKECGFVIHNKSLNPVMIDPNLNDPDGGPLFMFVIRIEGVLTKITYEAADEGDAKALEEALTKLGFNCYAGDSEIE